jgi:hypothetical protein
MKEGNLKPKKQYIFYRAYCLVVVLIWTHKSKSIGFSSYSPPSGQRTLTCSRRE